MTKQKELINLYKDILNDPTAEKIEYSISDRYISDLTSVFGIKEFIANFFDANGKDFEMNYQQNSLILSDNNQGINIQYMIIGNSGSRQSEMKIGEHGEGFKVGALTLVREGYKVLFHTVGYTIAFTMEYNEILKANVMVAKYRHNDVKQGTSVFLECTKSDYEKARNMFLELSDYEQLTEHIIVPTHSRKTKEIYLNGLHHTNKNALFSYNFKQKGLVSNRDRNFIKQSVIEDNLLSIYSDLEDPKTIQHVMKAVLENHESFSKQIESSIFYKLPLSEEQKQTYRTFIPSHYYFVQDESLVHDKMKAKNHIIKVDERLFSFLEIIEANVISNKDKDNSSGYKTFSIPIDKLPSSEDIEVALMSQIRLNPILGYDKKTSTLQIELSEFEHIDFTASLFQEYLQSFTLALKVYKIPNSKDRLKSIINNLFLLSCHGIPIQFKIENQLFTITSEMRDKYYISVHSVEDDTIADATLFLTKPLPTDTFYFKEEKHYLYLYGFKLKSIDSVLSYILQQSKGRINEELLFRDSFHAAFQKKAFSNLFIKELIANRDITKSYEYDKLYFSKNVQVDMNEWFEKNHPQQCLSYIYKEEFDKEIKNVYGYSIFTCSTQIHKLLEKFYLLKTSKDVFEKLQEHSIHTIDYTDSMKEAVVMFKEIYPTATVDLYSAYQLPAQHLSLSRDNAIYISKNLLYPSTILSLLHYEYEQMKNGYSSPSHNLQSALSHRLLDTIL